MVSGRDRLEAGGNNRVDGKCECESLGQQGELV